MDSSKPLLHFPLGILLVRIQQSSSFSPLFMNSFFNNFFYFYFWLRWICIAVLRLLIAVASLFAQLWF